MGLITGVLAQNALRATLKAPQNPNAEPSEGQEGTDHSTGQSSDDRAPHNMLPPPSLCAPTLVFSQIFLSEKQETTHTFLLPHPSFFSSFCFIPNSIGSFPSKVLHELP